MAEIEDHFGCKPGYLGPIGLQKPVKIMVDREVAVMADWVCGANQADFHITGVNWGRDLPEPDAVADLRNVVAGDPSPDGKGELAIERGIEVGHVFYLGTKYSRAMTPTFLDENGKPQPFEMGCYGIGITRLPAAAIEQNHDERGIIWPDAIAPFTVVICPIGMDRSEAVEGGSRAALCRTAGRLGVDVLLDDRDERPGAMFADWELIGVPHRVTLATRASRTAWWSTSIAAIPRRPRWLWRCGDPCEGPPGGMNEELNGLRGDGVWSAACRAFRACCLTRPQPPACMGWRCLGRPTRAAQLEEPLAGFGAHWR